MARQHPDCPLRREECTTPSRSTRTNQPKASTFFSSSQSQNKPVPLHLLYERITNCPKRTQPSPLSLVPVIPSHPPPYPSTFLSTALFILFLSPSLSLSHLPTGVLHMRAKCKKRRQSLSLSPPIPPLFRIFPKTGISVFPFISVFRWAILTLKVCAMPCLVYFTCTKYLSPFLFLQRVFFSALLYSAFPGSWLLALNY